MKKRFILATISLKDMAGGLERNIVYLANYLASRDLDVSLATFDKEIAESFFEIDKRVGWYRLGHTTPHERIGFVDRLKLLRRMRRMLVDRSVETHVICFHHGILFRYIAASIFSNIRIICSERNSLSMYDYILLPKWNLHFFLLLLAHRVVVQLPSYIADYPRLLRHKMSVVHNPVFVPTGDYSGEREKLILSVGRLTVQKQFELLIQSFATVVDEFPEWHLVIVGDGVVKQRLLDLVDRNGLRDSVDIVDPVKDLSSLFEKASLYCQPSQWEGFPNAMAEAMAAGVIPVGFERTSGVADLIEDGVNGYLTPGEFSADALGTTIVRAIRAEREHEKLRENARRITQEYSVESWIECWRRVLEV